MAKIQIRTTTTTTIKKLTIPIASEIVEQQKLSLIVGIKPGTSTLVKKYTYKTKHNCTIGSSNHIPR